MFSTFAPHKPNTDELNEQLDTVDLLIATRDQLDRTQPGVPHRFIDAGIAARVDVALDYAGALWPGDSGLADALNNYDGETARTANRLLLIAAEAGVEVSL